MAVSDADIAFATDLFSDLGHVTSRKMFGGLGLYLDAAIFALVSSEGRIYVKTTPETAAMLADEGAEQFHNMPYWSLPESALDDPETACDWARRFLTS
ncbi:TfoX/Sxy family protein [Cognatiyoonia sp. IB215182]|uniref:TfoX/Sxy family protein n=1 Tax=Cognatiyoonia sp. IB215182 TaxID=3097353 RepID=UPI002A0AFC50|nr:TfoX/Sxy family protein [Cognatiyoonia sp. IB215182]MDX8353305.1 TfoX/Sxy family protein [Cognatiyoonia sp. IB215182]